MCALGRSARAQRGISLVEILVALVVALLITLAASGSGAVFTASQRQGIGAGGTTVNANTALAAIKADVASAGLGFFGDSSFLCHTLDYSTDSTVRMDAAPFSPVRITAGTGSDRLEVIYGSNIDAGANVLLAAASDATSAQLSSLIPAAVGQAVLLAPATPAAASPCVVRTVTAVAAATNETPLTLTFAATGHHNAAAFTTAPTYARYDRIALLGALQWSRYRIDGTNLLLEQPLTGNSAVLVRNVMAFRVQYGVTGAGSTTLTGWQNATGSWADVQNASVERISALRIGLVTRSAQREKEGRSGACEASAGPPTLFGRTVTADVPDPTCYRYRSAIVVVPLRNVVW